ncbi:MAG: GNAT family N-acetyltransferase [Longimicrobiales bacterium]
MSRSESPASRGALSRQAEGAVSKVPRPGIEVRALVAHDELVACVDLQRETWGAEFLDIVPASILKVTQEVGGVAAGAFDGDRLIGMVYGLTGIRDGRPVHWSHMLAVHEAYRDHGIGRRLKEFQRDWLLERGISVLHWTFDPLVARNAHLNLSRLGVRVDDYVPDLYGETGSPLHLLGTDRLIVTWETGSDAGPPGPESAVGEDAWRAAPVVNTGRTGLPLKQGCRPPSGAVRIEIPADIDAVASASLARARAWRAATRDAFLWYHRRGYRVAGFARDGEGGRSFYLLEKG